MRETALRGARYPATLVNGAVLTGLWVVLALLAPLLAHDPNRMNPGAVMQGPSALHWLGTDNYGRDIAARVLYGARVSLGVASLATAVAAVLGVPLGIAAALAGRLVDAVLMRCMDVLFAFPAILAALAIAAVTGGGLVSVILTIGVIYAPQFARIARAAVLEVRALPYVEAGRAVGHAPLGLVRRHILPNVLSPLLVQVSLTLSLAILLESALSFLGLGVQPPAPSLGRMLYDASSYMFLSPWGAISPGAVISMLVIGFNLVGDGLRDWLDPQLRPLRRARA